ncbi:hypothetical protein NQZ68_018887 [Dissostichus eleginoides]|nr:hypothetical protein NQZ68_018887 [Dissostichus eleginoides]
MPVANLCRCRVDRLMSQRGGNTSEVQFRPPQNRGSIRLTDSSGPNGGLSLQLQSLMSRESPSHAETSSRQGHAHLAPNASHSLREGPRTTGVALQ